MATARKTAAQKAADAAERDEYTSEYTSYTEPEQADHSAAEDAVAAVDAKAPKGETLQQLKNRLRNEAEREVLNNHKDEVITITASKYKFHNLEYVRRLSDEEKAAKAIEEYYILFPNLRPVTIVQAEQGQDGYTSIYAGAPNNEAEEPDNYRDVEAREGE